MKTQYDKKRQLIKVAITGKPTYEETIAQVKKAFQLSKIHKSNLFLFDFSRMERRVLNSVSAPYFHLENANTPKPSAVRKSAIVHSSNNGYFEFIEIVFTNRGYQVKTFRSEDDAITWLKQPTIPTPS